jgi:hypothetical protein
MALKKRSTSSRRNEPMSAPGGAAAVPPGTAPSATAVAAEALRTGVVPLAAGSPRSEIPREDEIIRVGDPDDRTLDNEYVGEQTPAAALRRPTRATSTTSAGPTASKRKTTVPCAAPSRS